MKYKIVNIHRNFKRNGDSKIVYAELREAETNKLSISATLDYIMEAVWERNLKLVDDKEV